MKRRSKLSEAAKQALIAHVHALLDEIAREQRLREKLQRAPRGTRKEEG